MGAIGALISGAASGLAKVANNNKKKRAATTTTTTTSSGGGGGSKNNSNLTSNSIPTSGIVETDTSYNGSYLKPDLGTDYQAKINEAKAKGDYASASYNEALRNAKVNYLNSLGDNTYSTTNEFTNTYGSKNKSGGTVYESKYNNFSSLPTGWSSANVNGINYTSDGNLIYGQGGTVLGSTKGVNPDTGEMTYNSYDDAKRAAYDSYLGNLGVSRSSFGDRQAYYDYMDKNNILSSDYINQVMNGTLTSNTLKKAETEAKKQQTAVNKYIDDFHDEEYTSLPTESQQVLEDNSFETDYRYQEYYDYMQNAEKRRLMGLSSR